MRRSKSESLKQQSIPSLPSSGEFLNSSLRRMQSMSSDKNSNLSRRRRSLSLNKVILGVIMVAFILLYVSIDNFYATHTSLHGEDNAARILKLSSVDVASDTIVANPTVHIVDGDKLRGQVYGQVSSQIKPLQNEVKALQTNINELVQLLQESKGANNEKEVNQSVKNRKEGDDQEESKSYYDQTDDSSKNIEWDKLNNKTISIFFNTYQKLNDTDTTSYEVIYDQMKRLNTGLLMNKTVYYSRFGKLDNWPYTKCTNKGHRECIEIAASENGDEVITLQYLYNFCKKNQDDRVVYIHSKGTHTKSWNNRMLKKVLMKAVSSGECLYQMGTNEMKCNTCSSQLSGVPPHYPGNMWVADCDYISQLIPPNDFEKKKSQVAKTMQNATRKLVPENDKNDYFITELDDGTSYRFHNGSMWMMYRESWLGTQRYAMEHWLGSHPEFLPCEVFSPKDGIPQFRYDTLKQKKVYADDLKTHLQMAPGLNFKESWHHPYKLHPWFRSGGKLYEYNALYSKVPPKSSWFYGYWDGVKNY